MQQVQATCMDLNAHPPNGPVAAPTDRRTTRIMEKSSEVQMATCVLSCDLNLAHLEGVTVRVPCNVVQWAGNKQMCSPQVALGEPARV